MKNSLVKILEEYNSKYPYIVPINNSILESYNLIQNCYLNQGKLLTCGNGGSAADADHIVGELLKGFKKKRSLNPEEKGFLASSFGEDGTMLSEKLQGSLPAINLCAHTSLLTAVINDIGGEEIYAQQVMGYGNPVDILIGISTSGNSKNVLNAGMVAKMKGMKLIALTGKKESKMSQLFDVTICVPSANTPDIQDMHTTVYHLLCEMIEAEFWDI